MPTPTPSWNTVRVFGTWVNQDGSLKTGTFKVDMPVRVTNATDDVIIPKGVFATGVLNTTPGVPSLVVEIPASDDPDNFPTGFQPILTVTFSDAPGEVYALDLPVALSGDPVGLDLRTVVLLDTLPAPVAVLVKGVPGGLAELNADGDVVDADGNVVGGSTDASALTSGTLSAARLPDLSGTYVPRGVVTYSGSTPFLEVDAGGAGAALHIASRPGFTGPYLTGWGVDHAGVTGRVVSLKANGTGETFDQWPAGGVGQQISARSATPVQNIDLYAGTNGVQYALKSGQGYTDGVSTQGSTTFTSASAAFVAGDVGKTLTSVQPTPDTIPAGTTIVSVTNGTTVVLSAAATATATGVSFMVGSRANATTQNVWRVFDTDSVTVLFRIRKGDMTVAVPVIARDANTSAFRVYGAASQTADLTSWRDSNTNILSRVDKNGTIATRVHAAPADADVANGECFFWFDQTAGAAKLMVKAKDSGGTVRTGSVALA